MARFEQQWLHWHEWASSTFFRVTRLDFTTTGACVRHQQRYARSRYNVAPLAERAQLKKHLARKLSVTEWTVNQWIKRIDEDTEKETKAQAFALWLACHSQAEIGEICSVTQQRISQWIETFTKNGGFQKNGKSLPDHTIDGDFTSPQKNIWTGHDNTPHGNFPGSTEPRWLDKYAAPEKRVPLHLYTPEAHQRGQ